MMAESNDTVLVLEDSDSNDGLTKEEEAGDGGDSNWSEDQTDDEKELTESSRHRPWSFEYYQEFFDVDTDQVLSRIWRSFIPVSSFMTVIERKPDLYGPFWICMTLALCITISGNFASFIKTGSLTWQYDFQHLSFAITAIYCYVWVVPVLLWIWLWWRGVKGKTATLLSLTCVYGYSLAIFVPSSLLFAIPNHYLRWIFVMVAMALSGAVLFRTFWPLIKKKDKKLAASTIAVILLLHAALSVGFVMYFFPVMGGGSAVAPSTSTPVTQAATISEIARMPQTGKVTMLRASGIDSKANARVGGKSASGNKEKPKPLAGKEPKPPGKHRRSS